MRDEKQIRRLLCLLAIALWVLTLVEQMAQRALKVAGQKLKGISPVYPTHVTDHPSAELILSVFKPIDLVIVRLAGEVICQVAALTSMRQQLLQSNSAFFFSETRVLNFPDALHRFESMAYFLSPNC